MEGSSPALVSKIYHGRCIASTLSHLGMIASDSLYTHRVSLGNSTDRSTFVSITALGTLSPVSYIPSGKNATLRVPHEEAEDTWTLMLTPGNDEFDGQETTKNVTDDKNYQWALIESIGKWDARWG